MELIFGCCHTCQVQSITWTIPWGGDVTIITEYNKSINLQFSSIFIYFYDEMWELDEFITTFFLGGFTALLSCKLYGQNNYLVRNLMNFEWKFSHKYSAIKKNNSRQNKEVLSKSIALYKLLMRIMRLWHFFIDSFN